ncbi:DUF3987 domain-containing protein [Streptomyces sp. UNOB3_S3]|uniref:DUF3987 domain-containing protein n=1 Tax=Streptomyces sp. UNOB3_S3 TaxID=2871682 RepID=UPI001E302563|nr:DUF3987 domain-containing protein [Streptomyces sp. UNOB3_S3]MCC3773659.1 DUF3987 domain-containing protein [Streptomyces sp. UNOB3_S3]
MTTPIFYGPIGRAVRAVAPFAETDPLGIYVAALAMWSAAIGGTVTVGSRGNARPVLLWSALVGKSSRGKGTARWAAEHVVGEALGRFLETHTTSALSSGASLVNHLWKQQEATEETERGRDVRALVLEEEWSEVLKRAKRDASYTTKLRLAWDGATLRNTTKDEAQEVKNPALVLHAHITPSDWATYVALSDAAGGSYNRVLPFLLGAVPMLDDDDAPLPPVDGDALSDAYAWATARPRQITLAPEARPLWRTVRRYARILSETLPEDEAVFIERTAEHTLRTAACLAASECSETITKDMLNAAFTLVRRSVQDAVRIVRKAAARKVGRQPRTLMDKVRARIEMHGGRATSSQVLPYVGATAEQVKSLPGIVVTTERLGNGGRPAVFFSFTDTQDQRPPAEPTPARPAAPGPAPQATRAPQPALRLVTPVPKTPRARPARPQPARPENPFLAVL